MCADYPSDLTDGQWQAAGRNERGYEASKKITGRERRMAVHTLGLVLAVVVHGAGKIKRSLLRADATA